MPGAAPVLHVAGWASWRTTGHHDGPRYSIMALNPAWVANRAAGLVHVLAPQREEVVDLRLLLAARQVGAPPDHGLLARYRGRLEARWEVALAEGYLSPGSLHYTPARGAGRFKHWYPVGGTGTLCCTCSVAHARAAQCHRAWAVPFLRRAGWRVVLDGDPVP